MRFKDSNGFIWKFKGYDKATQSVTLFNPYEDRSVEIHKSDIKKYYKQIHELDRNGFKITVSTRGWL